MFLGQLSPALDAVAHSSASIQPFSCGPCSLSWPLGNCKKRSSRLEGKERGKRLSRLHEVGTPGWSG